MIPHSSHFYLSVDSVKGRPWREVLRYESPPEVDNEDR